MYTTIQKADEYVEKYYSSTDPLKLLWQNLTETDKQVLLNRAEQKIDMLPLSGHAVIVGKAFPRDPQRDISLQAAETATIELAIHTQDEESKLRYDLQKQNVTSYRIGDLAENFTAAGNVAIDLFTLSIVFPHLQPWLGGGYDICPSHMRRRW